MQRYQITCASPLGEAIIYDFYTKCLITQINFNSFQQIQDRLATFPVGKYKIYRIATKDKIHRFSIHIYEEKMEKIVDIHLVLGEPPKHGQFDITENLIAKYGQQLVRIFN